MESGFDTLTGETRRLAVMLSAEAEDAANFYRIGVHDVTSGALGAIDTVEIARAELERIARDPDISDSLKASRLADGLTRAETAARSHLDAATTGLDSLKLELDKRLTPTRPEGVSDALLLDMKHDLAAIVDRETTPDRAQERAVSLAKEAVERGDSLAFHALAGGAMDLVYQRHGIDRAALAERFAAFNPSPAGKLLPKFRGAKSVPAVAVMAANAVDMALTSLRSTYGPMIESLKARAARAVPVR